MTARCGAWKRKGGFERARFNGANCAARNFTMADYLELGLATLNGIGLVS
jgi:hypothetical protein